MSAQGHNDFDYVHAGVASLIASLNGFTGLSAIGLAWFPEKPTERQHFLASNATMSTQGSNSDVLSERFHYSVCNCLAWFPERSAERQHSLASNATMSTLTISFRPSRSIDILRLWFEALVAATASNPPTPPRCCDLALLHETLAATITSLLRRSRSYDDPAPATISLSFSLYEQLVFSLYDSLVTCLRLTRLATSTTISLHSSLPLLRPARSSPTTSSSILRRLVRYQVIFRLMVAEARTSRLTRLDAVASIIATNWVCLSAEARCPEYFVETLTLYNDAPLRSRSMNESN